MDDVIGCVGGTLWRSIGHAKSQVCLLTWKLGTNLRSVFLTPDTLVMDTFSLCRRGDKFKELDLPDGTEMEQMDSQVTPL